MSNTRRPGSSNFGTDGYISRINGDRAVIIGNALAKIQPERIVLLQLTEIEKYILPRIFRRRSLSKWILQLSFGIGSVSHLNFRGRSAASRTRRCADF